jgi:hypothetical protein
MDRAPTSLSERRWQKAVDGEGRASHMDMLEAARSKIAEYEKVRMVTISVLLEDEDGVPDVISMWGYCDLSPLEKLGAIHMHQDYMLEFYLG